MYDIINKLLIVKIIILRYIIIKMGVLYKRYIFFFYVFIFNQLINYRKIKNYSSESETSLDWLKSAGSSKPSSSFNLSILFSKISNWLP